MKRLPLSSELLKEVNEKKPIDIETVLKINAVYLDALMRLSYAELSDDEFDFLESSIRKTPAHIIGYLTEMARNVTNKKKPESEDGDVEVEITESTLISSQTTRMVLQQKKTDNTI